MKKSKNLLLAKSNKNGTPAVWLTHSLWMVMRSQLVKTYCDSRRQAGESRARRELKLLDEMTDSFLWQYCEHSAGATAMDVYEIGSAAYFKPQHREEFKHLSAEDLKELGGVIEQQGYDAEKNRLLTSAATPERRAA